MNGREPLLRVEDLSVRFEGDGPVVYPVTDLSLTVDRGETVCLVGESGCGKTVTCESLTRLLPSPPAIVDGRILLDGQDVLAMSEQELQELRGSRIAHVFQNPQGALNHVYTVGWQIIEAIRLHRDVDRATARREAIELLDRVGIPDPGNRVDDYPHELSGGQKQRVMIAMALAAEPDLLIADEPTTALDVTIQASILDLMAELTEEEDMGLLFVTHDLGVVAAVADRVVVMYAGSVVEEGPVERVLDEPAHPYTRALLECLPGRGGDTSGIGGDPPDPTVLPSGCRFHPRCPHAVEACSEGDPPPLTGLGEEHAVSCIYYEPGFEPPPTNGDDAPPFVTPPRQWAGSSGSGEGGAE
ncbi:MAG: ABC transporter ATP-binding protein [Salinirussus sp.]